MHSRTRATTLQEEKSDWKKKKKDIFVRLTNLSFVKGNTHLATGCQLGLAIYEMQKNKIPCRYTSICHVSLIPTLMDRFWNDPSKPNQTVLHHVRVESFPHLKAYCEKTTLFSEKGSIKNACAQSWCIIGKIPTFPPDLFLPYIFSNPSQMPWMRRVLIPHMQVNANLFRSLPGTFELIVTGRDKPVPGSLCGCRKQIDPPTGTKGANEDIRRFLAQGFCRGGQSVYA